MGLKHAPSRLLFSHAPPPLPALPAQLNPISLSLYAKPRLLLVCSNRHRSQEAKPSLKLVDHSRFWWDCYGLHPSNWSTILAGRLVHGLCQSVTLVSNASLVPTQPQPHPGLSPSSPKKDTPFSSDPCLLACAVVGAGLAKCIPQEGSPRQVELGEGKALLGLTESGYPGAYRGGSSRPPPTHRVWAPGFTDRALQIP